MKRTRVTAADPKRWSDALDSTETLVRAALAEYSLRASPQAASRLVDQVAAGRAAFQVVVDIFHDKARVSAGFHHGGTRTELADVVVPIGVSNG